MQLRARKRTTAAAVAVIGTLLGGGVFVMSPAMFELPGSPAVPGPDHGPGPAAGAGGARAGGPASATAAGAAGGPVLDPGADVPRAASEGPAVWPRPQSMTADAAREVPLGPEAVLVAAPDADPYAVGLVRTALREAGVRTLHEPAPGEPLPERGTVVRLQGPQAQEALRALGAFGTGAGATAAELPSGGYRLAVGKAAGRDTVALAGVGEDGLFHAAQTLRQVLAAGGPGAGKVPGVVVRDWPTAPVRGTTEGFYGQPWTQDQRLAQLDFMGRTKQNRLLLAPGDDPYRTSDWREDYPAAQQAQFRELAERARANRVVLAWAVNPGQSMCLASAADRAALARKMDAMWDLGFRAFQVQFQDVSYTEWGCRADRVRYGTGPAAAAKAHAEVAGELAAHLAARHPGAAPLSLMPTEYHQKGATTYRTALASRLDGRVEVAWTGVGVVPRTITGNELAGARSAFGQHPLVTMDNYPVNDWDPGRVFLGPYTGREAAVAGGSAALLANAMPQAALSRIPLFTAADFAWNPNGYRPGESWAAAVSDLAGPDQAARRSLAGLAGNTASSGLGQQESAYLRPLVDEFWRTRGLGDQAAGDRLRAAFTALREAPARLPGLSAEAGPWLARLSAYGTAGELAVDLLRAQSRGDRAAAWKASQDLATARKALADPGAARSRQGRTGPLPGTGGGGGGRVDGSGPPDGHGVPGAGLVHGPSQRGAAGVGGDRDDGPAPAGEPGRGGGGARSGRGLAQGRGRLGVGLDPGGRRRRGRGRGAAVVGGTAGSGGAPGGAVAGGRAGGRVRTGAGRGRGDRRGRAGGAGAAVGASPGRRQGPAGGYGPAGGRGEASGGSDGSAGHSGHGAGVGDGPGGHPGGQLPGVGHLRGADPDADRPGGPAHGRPGPVPLGAGLVVGERDPGVPGLGGGGRLRDDALVVPAGGRRVVAGGAPGRGPGRQAGAALAGGVPVGVPGGDLCGRHDLAAGGCGRGVARRPGDGPPGRLCAGPLRAHHLREARHPVRLQPLLGGGLRRRPVAAVR